MEGHVVSDSMALTASNSSHWYTRHSCALVGITTTISSAAADGQTSALSQSAGGAAEAEAPKRNATYGTGGIRHGPVLAWW